ncbi:MAG: tetratricopeptide repeat protein, partial [Victivallales bacterium]|nr:tetratricopeptide repeat protein [Victivallales bacterium]
MRILLLTMALCLFSIAGEADKLLKQGNAALDEEKYEEALSLYDKALVESPENPYLIFNKGVAYFKQGEYEKSVKEYKLAIEKLASQKRGDSELEARAFASIGNACFLQAKPLLESNLEQASALCLGAITAFDEALRIRPEDTALQENRQAARMLLKKILGIKYMQAKEQQKQQEMAQKLKELAERQKQAADETAQQKPDVQKQEQLNQETQELMDQMSGQQQQQPSPQDPQQQPQQNPIQDAMQQARQA